MTMSAIRRNAPCPCGSGKRFKHCHGREFGPAPVPREIAESVRFVCFETHLEDFRLATNGGTAFVVRYKGKPFAITCRHVLNGFNIDNLVIADARFGRKVAEVRGMYCPRNLNGDVEDSDLGDICVIAFHKHDGDFSMASMISIGYSLQLASLPTD
jgi:SEC-C motif